MPSVDLRPRKRHPRDKRPARPMPFDVALRKFKIPHHFSDEILRMTEADMSKLCAAKSDKERIDLTEIDFFTVCSISSSSNWS